jgi:hypothetical protein
VVKVAFLRWRGREDLHLDLGLARERVDQRDSQRRAMIALERVAVNRPDVAYSRDYVSGRDDGNAGRGDLLTVGARDGEARLLPGGREISPATKTPSARPRRSRRPSLATPRAHLGQVSRIA